MIQRHGTQEQKGDRMKRQMRNFFCGTLGLAGLLLAGCARIDAVANFALSSGMGAVAVVHDQVLTGKVRLYTDRTGDVVLRKEKPQEGDLVTQCMGRLRFTASTQGVIDLRCNNSIDSALAFTMVGDISGYALGSSSAGEVSLAFGLSKAESLAYLRIAPPKRLVLNKTSEELEGELEVQ
jgi:hypothetical protein